MARQIGTACVFVWSAGPPVWRTAFSLSFPPVATGPLGHETR